MDTNDLQVLVYDIWYKRILADILLFRERQIPYSGTRTQKPALRAAKGRFADMNDMSPLVMSFSIGAVLLIAVHYMIPSTDDIMDLIDEQEI